MTILARRQTLSTCLAEMLQHTQTFAVLCWFALAALLTSATPDGYQAVSHKERLLTFFCFAFIPAIWCIWASILLKLGRRTGWWLAVTWNLVAILGTAQDFLTYLRQGLWVWFPTLFFLLLPGLEVGFLFAPSARNYWMPGRWIEAVKL